MSTKIQPTNTVQSPRPPFTRSERWLLGPIIIAGRLCLVTVSLAIWCAVMLPTWLALLLQTIPKLALKNVANVYNGAGTTDVARLDDLVLFWPRGFVTILRIVAGRYESGTRPPHDPLLALHDTILAIVFYSSIFLSYALAHEFSWIFQKLRDWVIQFVQTGGGAPITFLRTTAGLWLA
jgi:hypothetical protein